ncbi:MAG TPA: hypothetical protein VH497_02485 [Vicinamibacterales bacterium]
MSLRRVSVWSACVVMTTLSFGCSSKGPRPGTVLDEAKRAGVAPEQFTAASEDYFHDMDFNMVNGQPHRPFTKEEIQGRNMWLVWTGGDDRLWNTLTVSSVGSFDLLKTISSYPAPAGSPYGTAYGRHNRFRYIGLVNEPCYKEATGPDPNRYGLWLDVRDPACPPDPFADAQKYPGVKIGARGKTVPVGSYYGEPSGVVGLRLFPNPDFDENARKQWNPERFYSDPSYYYSPTLVRPYRVGMSCGVCHVGPNPIKPPDDPENPKWENLSSNVGAQYSWWDRIFNWRGVGAETSFFYQSLHTFRPGTLDTSLVSTDNINNPRTMNAVYSLLPRMTVAKRWGKETISGGGLKNKQFNDYVPGTDPLAQFFTPPSTTWTPRVLKDGSDSVGALGALNRVYLNIGLFSEEWLLHFRPLVGGQPISPIEIAVAERNSNYWRATEMQTPDMARFFLASTDPHHLKDAPGGGAYLTESEETVRRGRVVFAERCARCHSSKGPDLPSGLDLENANGPDYLAKWNAYWAWTKTDDFKNKMRSIVLADDFLQNNYLSTELRVPVTLLGTNACSPLATNAIRDNIWDNFSSESYKQLPSVGTIKIRHPETGAESDYALPAGGRGYIRPASLVSAWSTAPFLQNNTVGRFEWNPSVESRMRSFQDSIEQMLWPEKREKDGVFANDNGPGVGVIDRTTVDSYVDIPEAYIPEELHGLVETGHRLFPDVLGGSGGSVRFGPFPKGMPVNLVSSLDLLGSDLPVDQRAAHRKRLLAFLTRAQRELKETHDLAATMRNLTDEMLGLTKCKDFVVNKGHYFGTSQFEAIEPGERGLTDDEKRALIAFIKMF